MSAEEQSGWEIRVGGERDVPAVLDLWLRSGSRPSATDDGRGVLALLARDPEALLVAVEGERIVGSLIVGWDGWRGSFYRLAVDPDRRRLGLGTALVRAGEERLRSRGAIRLTAIAVSEELPATALWEAAGYERQADTSRFVRNFGDR